MLTAGNMLCYTFILYFVFVDFASLTLLFLHQEYQYYPINVKLEQLIRNKYVNNNIIYK